MRSGYELSRTGLIILELATGSPKRLNRPKFGDIGVGAGDEIHPFL